MRRLSCTLLLVSACCYAGADTSVWRVSKGAQELFIGGTVHVLGKKHYPLPREFSDAYSQADQLVFETDLTALKQPDFQQQLLQRMTYADGQTARDELNLEVYQALESYCASRGIDVALLDRFKPPMLALTLVAIELQRLGISSAGVDEHFHRRAQQDGKSVEQLESITEQLNYLTNMGKGRENELVLSVIEDVSRLESLMDEIVVAWRKGEQRKLVEMITNPMRRQFPRVYENLLIERNNRWLPRIESMLETTDIEFVLVGVLHLVGEGSVLHKLRERGYKVERF